jgi:hypothetical protein
VAVVVLYYAFGYLPNLRINDIYMDRKAWKERHKRKTSSTLKIYKVHQKLILLNQNSSIYKRQYPYHSNKYREGVDVTDPRRISILH